MAYISRPATDRDLGWCAAILEDGFERHEGLKRELPRLWKRLLRDEAMAMIVIEDDRSSQLVAFGAGVVLSDECVERIVRSGKPHLAVQVLERERELQRGRNGVQENRAGRVILRPAEIRKVNHPGHRVNLCVLHYSELIPGRSFEEQRVIRDLAVAELIWAQRGYATKEFVFEFLRTREQVARIARLGGLIGVGWVQRDVKQHRAAESRVANDAAGSAKSWAQAYLYAVEQMDGPVAFGSDTHGVVGAPGPRFGPRAASGLEGDRVRYPLHAFQAAAQRDGVRYDGSARPVPRRDHPPLTMCRTGRREFDVNVDGVAHYGMLPDFLQDLRNVGMSHEQLVPLFSSAERYISVWDRAEQVR